MTNSCPECGEPMEFEQREVRLRTGVCPACAKEFAFVEGATVSGRLGAPPSGGSTEAEPEEGEEAAESTLECDECGSPLSVRDGGHGSLAVVCAECETTTIFVPKRGSPRERYERPGRPESEIPRGRPCRKCGAPLRFSTGEDGLLVGECDSCGNRFTLPPRPDRNQGPGGPGGDRFGRREFPRGPEGRPRYPPRQSGPGRRPFRGAERRRGPPYGDDRFRRKRRRPRDE